MAYKESIRAMEDAREFTAPTFARKGKNSTSRSNSLGPRPQCSVPNCAQPCRVPPSPPGCKVCRVA